MQILNFTRLADLCVPNVRNTLNDVANRSKAHAWLAYCYIHQTTIPALRQISRLRQDEADAQAEQGTPPH